MFTSGRKSKTTMSSGEANGLFNRQNIINTFIDLFHNGCQINYSFVLMLISPTNLATTSKFQKNIFLKTRAVGLININTKECKVDRHL